MAVPAITPLRARLALDLTGWAVVLLIATSIAAAGTGGDVHAYWSADGYGRAVDTRDAFLYTPPFLLGLQPLQIFPWEAFRLLWLACQIGALVWLVGPVIAALVLIPGAYSPVYIDLWYGNLMVFSAALVVAGFRNAYWWAVLPFGKLLPGVALLAGGWRPMAIAAAVAGASVVLAPGLWHDWMVAMLASVAEPPENGLAGALIPRAVIAIALVGLLRLRGWRWTLPVAVMLAQPVLWYSSLTILLGSVRLLRDSWFRAANPAASKPALLPVIVRPERRELVPVLMESRAAAHPVSSQRARPDLP